MSHVSHKGIASASISVPSWRSGDVMLNLSYDLSHNLPPMCGTLFQLASSALLIGGVALFLPSDESPRVASSASDPHREK